MWRYAAYGGIRVLRWVLHKTVSPGTGGLQVGSVSSAGEAHPSRCQHGENIANKLHQWPVYVPATFVPL